MRDTIVDGIARALWASSFADSVDELRAVFEGREHGAEAEDRPYLERLARALWAHAYGASRSAAEDHDPEWCARECDPGAGGDWADACGDTPPSARAIAERLAVAIEHANRDGGRYLGASLAVLYDRAASAEGHHYRDPSPDDFGWYLGMQALGHGVSWSDNHPPHGLEVPHLECSAAVDADGAAILESY